MRTFCNSLLAALIIAALFWGNCFSCPQILLAAKHSCCHKNKQPSAGCQTQVLKQFVKAETHTPAPPIVAGILPVPMTAILQETPIQVSGLRLHDPPDIFSLRI